MITDFDENKQLDNALKKTSEELQEIIKEKEQAEKFNTLIFENNPDCIFVKDTEFRIALANQNFLNMYPKEKQDKVIGYTTLEDYSPDEVEMFLEMDKKAFFEGFSETTETITFPDGVCRTLHTKKIRFEGVNNEQYILGIATDVTESKKMEDKLIKAKELAESANKAKSKFLSSMSHEFRTPLNTLLGFSQLLAMDTEHPLTQDQLELLSHVINSGQELLSLIDNVLDFSNFEAGNLVLTIEDIDVNMLIADVCHMLQPQANTQSITLDNHAAADSYPLVITSDRQKVMQVLLNIVSNAIKYNSEKGTITLSAHKTNDGKVRVSISDTGDGIPQESFPALFEPFNRLDREGLAIEGTGIGLSICKQLVEFMDGEIGVFQNPEKGLTFWVEFEQA